MPTLLDMARMTTGTVGTGTITLGSAVQSFLTFAQAGATDQMVLRYVIEDSPNREVGSGTYTASGATLTRNVTFSTNSNNPINLSGNAQIALTALAEDIVNKAGDTMTGALNWATAVTLASASTVNIGAAASNYVIISGTTAITAFDTIAQGALRRLRFQAALTLTNSANLICIGSVNITTVAGDIADVISEGGGIWRMTDFARASGAALTPTAPAADRLTDVQLGTAAESSGLGTAGSGTLNAPTGNVMYGVRLSTTTVCCVQSTQIFIRYKPVQKQVAGGSYVTING